MQRSRNGREAETRNGAGAAGVSNPRARQRAIAIGVLERASDEEPLAELKELLRTAGVATAGEMVQQRSAPDPETTDMRLVRVATLPEALAASGLIP